MKKETVSGEMSNAFNAPLPKPIKYSTEVEVFETYAEMETADEVPSRAETLKFVNTKRINNARQKAMNEALEAAGIKKPTLESSADLRLKVIVDALKASGKSEEEATALAKASLGIA